MQKLIRGVLALTQILTLSTALAEGGESGGGGSYALINGELTISDRYYQEIGQIDRTPVRQVTYAQLPESIRRASKHLNDFFQTIARSSSSLPPVSDYGNYFLVPKGLESQTFCNHYQPVLNRPVEQVRYGCTNGSITFLFVDAFERANLREQAYALLHERLWALRPNADQKDIAAFTTALHDFEDYDIAQSEDVHYRPKEFERTALKRLVEAGLKFGLVPQFNDSFEVAEHGGVVQKGCLSPESHDYLIGVGTLITCSADKAHTLISSQLIRSTISGQLEIEQSTLSNTNVWGGTFLSSYDSFTGRHYTSVKRIKNSTLKDVRASAVDITDSQLNGVTARYVMRVRSSQLTDVHSDSDGLFAVGAGSHLKKVRFSVVNLGIENRPRMPLESWLPETTVDVNPGTHIVGMGFETVQGGIGFGLIYGQVFGPANSLSNKSRRTIKDAEGNVFQYAQGAGLRTNVTRLP